MQSVEPSSEQWAEMELDAEMELEAEMFKLRTGTQTELETSEHELHTLDPPIGGGPVESDNVPLREHSTAASSGLPQHRRTINRCVAVTAVISAAYWCLAIVVWSNGFEGYAHEDSLSPVTLCEADNLGMACGYVNDYSAILQVVASRNISNSLLD